ncbi:hypothetical protein K7432_011173 [Basidiobolus ranarum]|uniref:Histidine kinase n=1 Tax=Basidiobolus ranarum TaxID=34480 RepID=A0ABR2WMR5_9FUNG
MAYERFIRATGPAVCKLVSADYSFFMIRDRGIAIPSPAFIPDPLALENYVKFIKASDITEIIVSNHVTKDFEGLTSSRGLAGVIHIPLSDDGKDWLCFCKMEEVAHVTWAGEPKKSMEPGTISGNDSEGHRYLMPRTSFSKWTQIIEGKSPQWNQVNPELLLTIKSVYEESLKTWKNKMLLIDNHQARNKNAELERAKRIAEESDKKKSMLLANVSHEGVIELVLDTQLDAEQKQMLVEAKQASNALTSIINDLLDFAKLEAGNLPMQDIPFNLPNLVVETSDMYCKVIEAKGIKFQTVVDSSLPQWIRGDPQRIKQILMNFVSNSCKYTNSGLIRVEAILFAVKEGDNVDIKLRVSDSGIGIPRDKQSLIFEKFEQADNSLSRAVSGTGLGLAIAQNLSVKMGGSIGFSSVQDVGSEFYVIIPFKVVDEHSPAEESIEIISSSATTPEEEIAANVPQPQATPTPHSKLPELNDREVSSGPDEDALSVSRISSTKEESSKPSADSPKKGHASNFRRKKANGKLTPTSSLSPVQLTQDQLHNISDDPNVTLYVLVVEDNVLNQTLILRMLQKLKYSVSVANNGQEAVDIYISKNRDDGHITFNKKGTAISGDVFDVILMDLQMPIMDGFEATQNILQFQAGLPPMQELRVAPIIAVTAQAMRGDRELCLSKGMKGYISKPIDFHLFRETLEGIKKEKIKNLRASEPIV